MGFLRFTLQLIDILAWPVLALGYPLFASIRAIETGSKYHMKKLVTYWIIFSFISMFEHVCEGLIEWVPLWPYIKLATICCLVIPQFNGASYLYQNLIHPCLLVKLHDAVARFYGSYDVYRRLLCLCLTVNLQTVSNWFNKPMEDPSLKNETFLDAAEWFLEENGADGLEKLIANKVGCKGGIPVWEDIKVMEHMEKQEAAEAKQIKSVKQNLTQIEKKLTTTVLADAEDIKLPEVTSSRKVQTEWTCAICQVTTTSEHDLNSHLNGNRHKAKCDELKTCKNVATNKSSQANQEQVKLKEKVNLAATTGLLEKPKQPKNGDMAFHDSTRLWCGTCNRWFLGEIAMATHVNGRRHLARLRKAISSAAVSNANEGRSVKENPTQVEVKTCVQVEESTLPECTEQIKHPGTNSSKKVHTEWTCAICQVKTKSEHDSKCHLRGRKHREKCEELRTFKKTAKTDRNPKENVQMNNAAAGGATHNLNLWCSFCNVWCPNKIAMGEHLNGKKHLAKIQETTSFTGGAWAMDYAKLQFHQGI